MSSESRVSEQSIPRKRRLDPSFGYRLGYVVANAFFVAVLYGVKTTALFNDDGTRNSLVEGWMWFFIASSWVAYLVVQGTDPGYIDPATAPAPDALTGADRRAADVIVSTLDTVASPAESVSASASASAAGASPTGASVASGSGAAAPPQHAFSSSGASDGLADSAEDDDREQLRPAHGSISTSTSTSRGPPSAAAVVAMRERTMLRFADADPDFFPETSIDPAAAAEEMAARAAAGARQCRHCQSRQPARAHHCRHCNKCVRTFDHHCGVIGTCIGERNRCRFWWFLTAQTAALAFAIGLLNTGLVWRRTTAEWTSENSLALFALILLWLCQLLVFPLWVFHTWLAATNTTTFETITGSRRLWYLAGSDPRDCDLPYSRGLCGNLRLFCCVLDTWRLACSTKRAVATRWQPAEWPYPGVIERDSADVCNNPWSNQYYSCC